MTDESIAVLDIGVHRVLAVHLHLDGVLHELLDDPSDLRRHRGRKEPGQFVVRGEGEDLVELVLEAHIEHFVRFIEHEVADGLELHRAALDQVDQAAGGGDQDLLRLAQGFGLFRDARTPVDGQGVHLGLEAAESFKLFGGLPAKFAGRSQDEGLGGGVRRVDAFEKG